MKKSIVIVTWIGGGNYGTSLQSFSLHRKIENLGYNTSIVIPLIPQKYNVKNLLLCVLNTFGIDSLKIKKLIKGDKRTVKQKKLDAFEKKYYHKRKIYFPWQIKSLNRKTDVYVTGSDQIWNTVYRFDPFYFLDFAEEVKRVAYASSMGINDFPPQHMSRVKEMLSKFYKIGVREETAVKSISRLLDRNDIRQVLDPTFLLNAEEWSDLSDEARIEFELPQEYLFCYFVGNNPWYTEQVEVVKRTTGINKVIQVCLEETDGLILPDAINYFDSGPIEFVKLIKNAKFVCTDSFHATALSLNLKKDFVEFMRFKNTDKSSQNSRIYDVLNHYGLGSRIFSAKRTDWGTPINYVSITKQLNSDREKSINFLVNAIEG